MRKSKKNEQIIINYQKLKTKWKNEYQEAIDIIKKWRYLSLLNDMSNLTPIEKIRCTFFFFFLASW